MARVVVVAPIASPRDDREGDGTTAGDRLWRKEDSMGVIAAPSNGRGASSRRRRRDGEQSVAVVGRMEDQEEIIMQRRKPPEPDDVHGFSFPPQIKKM